MKDSQLRPRHWVAIGLGLTACIALLILIRQGDISPRFAGPPEPDVIITTGTVKGGDVFALLLQKSGVPAMQIPQIQRALSKLYDLRRIQPGHVYEIVTSTSGVIQKFIYRVDPVHSYSVVRSSNTFEAAEEKMATVWMEKRISLEITRFLEADLRSAGYDQSLIDNLSWELGERIFGWRIDFFTEQRKGDTLEVLLEQEYPVGEDHPIPGGKHMRVIAASYTGSGTKFKENIAIRYQAPGARDVQYYDEKGGAVARVFLRAPFTKGAFRVSSGFNLRRFHPILRTYRAHHGTDYAASHGTPVSAIGAGTVVRAEWYKGYGKCVDIRHNNRYVSRYGHLSRIAVRAGSRVNQGQYIGNVGSTGLSTGPHLHFEMLVNGEQRNFLAMSFPAASSVAVKDMEDFKRVRDEALARLNADMTTKLSMNVSKQ
jgi:murein DD-endopeptidase MepM/ murein hydrolase activator NlpD